MYVIDLECSKMKTASVMYKRLICRKGTRSFKSLTCHELNRQPWTSHVSDRSSASPPQLQWFGMMIVSAKGKSVKDIICSNCFCRNVPSLSQTLKAIVLQLSHEGRNPDLGAGAGRQTDTRCLLCIYFLLFNFYLGSCLKHFPTEKEQYINVYKHKTGYHKLIFKIIHVEHFAQWDNAAKVNAVKVLLFHIHGACLLTGFLPAHQPIAYCPWLLLSRAFIGKEAEILGGPSWQRKGGE